MAYLEWGDPRNRDVLICVHGLTRAARDFDEVARALCDHYRVVCPDVAGRGDSDRLADPMLYVVPQYAADMVTLIARLDVESVIQPARTQGGQRRYSRGEIHRVKRVADMAEEGMTLVGIRRILVLEARVAELEQQIAELRREHDADASPDS